MVKEIGSDFSIDLDLVFKNERNNVVPGSILLFSGRDCISYLIKSLKLDSDSLVLLPSYLCSSVLIPFKENGVKYDFYKVDENLEVDVKDLSEKIEKKPSFVLIVNYFGFIQPKLNEVKSLCEKNGVKLVEDNVQSFLTEHNPVGDFVFNSYRKFLSIPDGAYLFGAIKDVELSDAPSKFVSYRSIAGFSKNISFLKEFWRKLFVESEDKLIDEHVRPAKMSSFSKYLLNKFDFDEIISKRRRNYFYLIGKLSNVGGVKVLYPELKKEVCPLGCPILVESRDEVRNKLILNKIYPPVHWELPEDVGKEHEESWKLSGKILTIPIDQRYSIRDMDKVVEVFNKDGVR